MMLKYLFTLALLAPMVFCRFSPAERQGIELRADGPEGFNCTCECEKTCECECKPGQCYRCGEDEKFCKRVPYPGHESCPPEFWDDCCVPKNCECPIEGKEHCPRICTVECNPPNILCCVDDIDGCKQNDYCHTVKPGCIGFCPVVCGPGEKECAQPDDENGCPVKPLCLPKDKVQPVTIPVEYCECQYCPITCDDETQDKCPGPIDHRGCPGPETCIPKCCQACPPPLECSKCEIKCKGAKDCETGCVEPDFCKTKVKDINCDYCPDDSASHGCPVDCCDGIVCEGKEDALGCLPPAVCMAKVNGTDEHGCPVECPAHSVCPCECGVHEVCCPNNNLDENGCKCADYCMEQEMGYDGRLCTVQCPCECAENEICCPGWRNSMGCLEANECISVPTKTRGDCIGEPCPAFCPAQCKHDEVKCPSQIDPCDGCPTEEVCRKKVKSLDGDCCSVDPLSASHNCPVLCDEINGYVLCPAHMHPNGCKDPAECRKRTKDNDGHYCPAHSVCPFYCDEDEVLCREGDDPRGCKGKCFCWPRGTDCDGNLCDGWCPPVCKSGEVLVPGGQDERGCERPPTCQPDTSTPTRSPVTSGPGEGRGRVTRPPVSYITTPSVSWITRPPFTKPVSYVTTPSVSWITRPTKPSVSYITKPYTRSPVTVSYITNPPVTIGPVTGRPVPNAIQQAMRG